MRIFVAGGTGVVGRRVVPALLAEGHEVTVLVRAPRKADDMRASEVRPVQVSLFEPERLSGAVAGHDAVINLATSIPPFSKAARASAWALNDRIRSEGSKNLVDAAAATGVERYVQESVAFLYADAGSAWIHEDHAIRPSSITASAALAEVQARRLADRDVTAVVLRFGAFYGPDSGHTIAMLRLARLGLAAIPGPRGGSLSSITTDDAAAAVVAAVTAAPSGTYNVVDDEPVTRDEFDRVLARAVGRRRLRSMPDLVLRVAGDKLDHLSRSQRVSNQALRTATGWAPTCRSVREGLPAVVAAARSTAPPTREARRDG